ncbi:glycoside hydrolase family protein [Planctomycetota bacterium]
MTLSKFSLSVGLALSAKGILLMGLLLDPMAVRGKPKPVESDLCQRLAPVAHILEQKEYYTWDPVALDGPDGKVHLYFSRWPADTHMVGWLTHSEVAHAVADRPEGPYRVTGVVLKGAGGEAWDADSVHNPQVQKIGNQYIMVYMGRSNKSGFGQFTGIAVSDRPEGPFRRISDQPVIPPSPLGAWDYNNQCNPALLVHPNGEFWLYYKGRTGEKRSVGLAISKRLEGPYQRHASNPVIVARNEDLEDYFIWYEDNLFKMLIRDRSGELLKDGGMYYESDDGVNWSEPTLAFYTHPE